MPSYRATYLKDFVCERIVAAYHSLRGAAPDVEVEVRPADRPAFGDFSTNLAMVGARQDGAPPRPLAEALAAALPGSEFA